MKNSKQLVPGEEEKVIYMLYEFQPEFSTKHLQYAFQIELKTNPTIKKIFVWNFEVSEKQLRFSKLTKMIVIL